MKDCRSNPEREMLIQRGYYDLAAAILKKACDDYREYRKALNRAKEEYDIKRYLSKIREVEKFMLSGFGRLLSGNLSEVILERLRSE